MRYTLYSAITKEVVKKKRLPGYSSYGFASIRLALSLKNTDICTDYMSLKETKKKGCTACTDIQVVS